MIFCLFHKQQKDLLEKYVYYVVLYVVFDWLAKMIFSHVKKYRIFYACLNTIFLSDQ